MAKKKAQTQEDRDPLPTGTVTPHTHGRYKAVITTTVKGKRYRKSILRANPHRHPATLEVEGCCPGGPPAA